VALIGNPNTGKSTLFGAISGVRQRVGNYPGVTVEKKVGQFTHRHRRWTVVDLPGTYSLAPRSPDEMVAVDVLLGRQGDVPPPDVILCVVAADNLQRNLYLVSQILELGRPTVLALTMMDVAEKRGVTLDVEALRRRLGIPVVPVQAHRRQGLEALKEALGEAIDRPAVVPESPFPEDLRTEVDRLEALFARPRQPGANTASCPDLPRYLVERLLLDVGGYVEGHLPEACDREAIRNEVGSARQRLARAGHPVPAVEAMARYGWVARLTEGILTHPLEQKVSRSERIDAWLTHRIGGAVVLVVLLLLMFQAVFTWATVPMDWIEGAIGWLSRLAEANLPEGALRSLLIDGGISGVGAVIVFLPQILILFFFLAILEDCGYLARAAYLMDRLMVPVGLSGKSFIPLLSSFACAVPGIMATRVIENRRDRLTTILVAPLMSCSARLPVYTLMIGAFVPSRNYLGGLIGVQALLLFGLYGLGIVTAAVVAFVLKRTWLRGAPPPFVLELPPYKWPSPWVVLGRMWEQAREFLYRAGTLIFAVAIVMWACLYYPRLSPEAAAPLIAERESLHRRLDEAQIDGDRDRDPAAVARLERALVEIENRLDGAQKRQSLLGRGGRWIEPVVRPLGWDWRIGSAVIASFPAREVVVSTLGVIFDVGEEAGEDDDHRLRDALKGAVWDGTDRPLFTMPVALSIVVFFALCAQCVSTLAVIQRETRSWVWPAFSFAYMTVLAYLAALITYQGSRWLGA
jgi:ferrous iron transport protein B